MASDGFSLDVGAAQEVVTSLGAVAADYAHAYERFGTTSSAGTDEMVWGRPDANGGGPSEVGEAWGAFATAWGQLLDEGVGAVTKVRQAVAGAVADVQRGDTSSAASIAGVLTGDHPFDLSGDRALVAPDALSRAGRESERWDTVPSTPPDVSTHEGS